MRARWLGPQIAFNVTRTACAESAGQNHPHEPTPRPHRPQHPSGPGRLGALGGPPTTTTQAAPTARLHRRTSSCCRTRNCARAHAARAAQARSWCRPSRASSRPSSSSAVPASRPRDRNRLAAGRGRRQHLRRHPPRAARDEPLLREPASSPPSPTYAPGRRPRSMSSPAAARHHGSRQPRRHGRAARHRPQHRAAARAGANPYITPELCFQFHYFALRKMHFVMRSVALVCFPVALAPWTSFRDAHPHPDRQEPPPPHLAVRARVLEPTDQL